MDYSETISKAHESNVRRLIDEYGADKKERIQQIYSSLRKTEEERARIHEFTPIFIYRQVRSILDSAFS